ncbi:MAG: beta-lactamase family protein [Pirellulales bacterium]|nr:beta-lactamase family protein [Pirellulales bacterium]
MKDIERPYRFVALAGAMAISWTAAALAQDSETPPERLDRLVPGWMAECHVPGVSVVGVEDGRIAWQRHYGVRRAGSPGKVDTNTLFEACSMTKPPFAYVTMKLVEQGRLDLDRPLVEYLDKPYLPDQPRHRRITARMVLSHTTGFPNWRPGGWRSKSPLKVGFEPGSRFEYSGEGYYYLQTVVEHITGTPAEKLMKERLFDPLGMAHSSYVWEDRFAELAAAGHDAEGRLKENRPLYRRANAGFSLYCSARDYATFLTEMLDPDRSAAHSLSAKSLDAMLTRAVLAAGRKPVTRSGHASDEPVWWTLGWPVDAARSGDRVYHGGANGSGFRCYAEFDRRTRRGLVIMTNSLSGEALWRRVVDAVSPP